MMSEKADETRARMRARLEFIYGAGRAADVMRALEELLRRYEGRLPRGAAGWSERDALLITYADTIREDGSPPLRALDRFLTERVGDRISFVHLLPFYPYSSDDGFAVQDFRQVRPELGSWDDVALLARHYRLAFDAVINHVSASGVYARGYCAGDPRFRDFFIALDPGTDTSSVLRTRNLPLLHDYDTSEGRKWLWTTFSRDQVDLNLANPRVLLEVVDVLLFYVERGASVLRLDAIPYLWKELGTSCAHLPRTHELIKLLRDVFNLAAPHVLLLAECNVPQRENLSYLGAGGDEAQVVYNFTMPPLVLFSIHKGDASRLTEWARTIRKVGGRATYLNVTATHDGIGMRPTEGLLGEPERGELLDLARAHGGDVTGKRNPDGSISPYELNLNYFDAVNDPRAEEPLELQVRRFMLSQAIPLGFIGIPAVYVHSLLGSRNDLEGVRRTGRARSINRAVLRADELCRELDDGLSLRGRVFREYGRLLEVRRRESAFHPDADQEVPDLGPAVFAVLRRNEHTGERILALHNVTGRALSLSGRGALADAPSADLLTGEQFAAGADVPLDSYQVRWLRGAD